MSYFILNLNGVLMNNYGMKSMNQPSCTTITLSLLPDIVSYLIHTSVLMFLLFLCLFPSVELQKANLEAQNSPSTGGSGPGPNPAAASPLASAIPLAQLLAKPGALNALSSLSALGGLTELLGAQAGAPPVQTTGVHRTHKSYTPRLRSPGGSGGPTEGSKLKERNKFNPY